LRDGQSSVTPRKSKEPQEEPPPTPPEEIQPEPERVLSSRKGVASTVSAGGSVLPPIGEGDLPSQPKSKNPLRQLSRESKTLASSGPSRQLTGGISQFLEEQERQPLTFG
jgi:hypothetical protein